MSTHAHTATRGDMLVAYADKTVRVGAEYFTAKNWNNVLSPVSDKADGYSVWGSVGVADGVALFARYDIAKLSKDIDPSAKDTYYNAGVEFDITKGFKLAAVYKHEKSEVSVVDPGGARAEREDRRGRRVRRSEVLRTVTCLLHDAAGMAVNELSEGSSTQGWKTAGTTRRLLFVRTENPSLMPGSCP